MEVLNEFGHDRIGNTYPQQVVNIEKRKIIKRISKKMLQLEPTYGFTEVIFRDREEPIWTACKGNALRGQIKRSLELQTFQ